MGEPLKNRRYVKHFDNMEKSKNGGWLYIQNVKSAVEWLKEQEIKLLESYWLKEITWTEFKTKLIELKNKAFPDLCPSGDLITDKKNPQSSITNNKVAD